MIKRRSMGWQVVLVIITLGLYAIYWFYVTSKEMIEYRKLEGSAGVWTVLALIPFVQLYAYWKQGGAVEALTEGKYNQLLVFLAWVVFTPVGWFITQTELNTRATD